MANRTKLVIAGAAVVAAAAIGYVLRTKPPKHEEIAKPTSVESDAGPRSASCGFATKTAFLLSIVDKDGAKRVLVKEGDKVQIGSKDYTVVLGNDRQLRLENSGVGKHTTIYPAEKTVREDMNGELTFYAGFSTLGLVDLREVARYEDNKNYASRAAVALTAGSRTKTFIVEEGDEVSVTSPDGKTTTTARFIEGFDDVGFFSIPGKGRVPFAEGTVDGPVKVESVTDEYDQSSTAKAEHCREYAVTLLFNTGAVARDFELVEGAELNVAGHQITVEKVQYDEDPEKRFVRLSIVAGSVTSTVVLRNGEMTTLEGGDEVTQVVLVYMSIRELRSPVPPDAGSF